MNKPTASPFLKTKRQKTGDSKPGEPIPVLFVIFMSVFIIVITLVGVRQIKDTIRFRNPVGNPDPSFEEVLSGVFRMEGYPQLEITGEQASKIAPIINPYIDYLDIFSRMEIAASSCLSDEQKEFIISRSGQTFNPGIGHQIPPGFPRIQWIYEDLKEFSGSTVSSGFDVDSDNTDWLNRMPGIEDMIEGLFRLKQEGKLEQSQAAYLLPFLKDMAEAYEKIEEKKEKDKEKILTILSKEQVNFLKSEHKPVPPDFLRTYLPDIARILNKRSGNS